MKNFFASKINWAAIIVIFVAIKDAIANMDFSKMNAQGWITFSLGILIIIFRSYFTSQEIKMPGK